MTSIKRRRLLVVAAAMVLVALLVVTMQVAFADTITWRSETGFTDSSGEWPEGQSFGTGPVGVPNDSYHAQINHWNVASVGPVSMRLDDASATNALQVTEWTNPTVSGSSVNFDGSTSVVYNNGTSWVWSDKGDDASGGHENHSGESVFHAPAVYPSFVQGCHWGQCTWDSTNDGYENAGMPYPIRARDITNLNSTFEIGIDEITDIPGTDAATGVWNASFDIWLDTGNRVIQLGWTNQYPPSGQPDQPYDAYVGWPILPSFPGALMQYDNGDQRGQPDGAEIMIWMNNRGYGHGDGNPIRPAGTNNNMIGTAVPIPISSDLDAKWDIWVGRSGQSGYPQWNVISYVKVSDTSGTNPNTKSMSDFDANVFIQHAAGLNDCPTEAGGDHNGATCVSQDWWLTSVQAGFEIWAKGKGLEVKQFSVKPNTNVQVETGLTHDSMTRIHWDQKFLLRYKENCGATSVKATVADNAGRSHDYNLTASSNKVVTGLDGTTNNNMWAVRAGPLAQYGIHNDDGLPGGSTVVFTPSGGSCSGTTIVDVYIDPSGVVVNTLGEPIEGADVTLSYAPGVASTDPEPAADAFDVVPDGSDIMSPENRDNPDQTDANGYYRWDVQDGWYKVKAEKDGCTSAESPALPVSEGNPATNVNLVLDCGEGTGDDDLLVQVTPQNDWGTGYCKNVTITNNGSEAVDWQINLEVEGTIYDFWNVIWSQSGNQVTAEGVDWNNILQPGESTHSIGFCANRTTDPTPGPGGVTVTVTTQSDWGTGYCANVTVTNNTSAAVDWKVTFPVIGTVNNLWNAIWSQSGNQVTAEGVSWNNILQPGQSTHSIGFCAAK